MDRLSTARRAGFALVLALAALTLAWQVFDLWPGGSTVAALMLGLPIAAVLGLHVAGRRSATFWSGVLALFAFSHGVMEAWAEAAARTPALAEIAISVALVLAASWDGLRARASRRRPPPAV
jgi:uncharacterized membrane protein